MGFHMSVRYAVVGFPMVCCLIHSFMDIWFNQRIIIGFVSFADADIKGLIWFHNWCYEEVMMLSR